jgi:hypothetical protein
VLFLECKPDESLARTLGCPRKECLHFAGKSRICLRLERVNSTVALLDEDPRSEQPSYLARLNLIEERHDIRILQDASRGNRSVILQPRLEEWIIRTAQEVGLELTAFRLSANGNELHREINTRLRSFEKLLVAILSAKSARLMYLKQVLGL